MADGIKITNRSIKNVKILDCFFIGDEQGIKMDRVSNCRIEKCRFIEPLHLKWWQFWRWWAWWKRYKIEREIMKYLWGLK